MSDNKTRSARTIESWHGRASDNAGKALERLMAATCDIYRREHLAEIEKAATPTIVVGGRPIRTGSAAMDYRGVMVGGRAVFLECKSIGLAGKRDLWKTPGGRTRDQIMPRQYVRKGRAGQPGQVDRLDAASRLGACVLLVVQAVGPGEIMPAVYAIPWQRCIDGVGGIGWLEFAEYEAPVRCGVYDVLDLLES